MFSVGLSEVTSTHTAGRSHSRARTHSAAVSATGWGWSRPGGRERSTASASVLRVPAQDAELQHGEGEDHREEGPRHGGGRAELEEVGERRLVEVLDHGACGV